MPFFSRHDLNTCHAMPAHLFDNNVVLGHFTKWEFLCCGDKRIFAAHNQVDASIVRLISS